MTDHAYDPIDEFAMDLMEDFSDELDEKQQAQINHCRELIWRTLAILTEQVPPKEDCTPERYEQMWMALKSCLMLRNSIRRIVLEARDEPIPSPEELDAWREHMKPSSKTVH